MNNLNKSEIQFEGLINDEIGLGRKRSEINHIDFLQNHLPLPSIEEESIFEELGLGKQPIPQENTQKNDSCLIDEQ